MSLFTNALLLIPNLRSDHDHNDRTWNNKAPFPNDNAQCVGSLLSQEHYYHLQTAIHMHPSCCPYET